jgi:two-component system, sensor histidine kinase and response regulator
MVRPRNDVVWAVLGAMLALVLPVVGMAIAGLLLPEFRFIHLPLHSLIEGAGGVIALTIAGVLLAEIGRKANASHYACMAAGFASMGVLDLFHAASTPGNHFVWLHSTATFAGGVFFGLMWFCHRVRKFFDTLRFPAVVAILAVVVGGVSMMAPGIVPAMNTPEGAFSHYAQVLNLCGGLGFLAASMFLLRRFFATRESEDWVFAMQSMLFGAAGVLFAYSTVWDGSWWWWHVLRLTAYIVALSYGLRTFRDAERELRQVNRRLAQTNAGLDRTIAERTRKLRESEERFELAVRGSTDGIWDWSVLTNEVFYSPRMKELIGYSDDEFPNVFASFESRLHADDHDWVMRTLDEHLRHHKPYDVEYRLLTKSGEYRWYRARGQAVWNEAGQAQRMAGSITDVTESHRLRERFRLAVEASPAALLMVQQDGRIVMANSRGLKMFGYIEEELIGKPIEVLVPPRFRAGHPAHRDSFFRNPARREMGAELELFGVRKDGSELPIKVGLSQVVTAEGQAVICGVLDVTDQKKTFEAMEQAKQAAESASRAKSSFLANMSHEIRTPMNGIIGMAQLLAQTELRSHQRDYLATIDESAQILLRLLNDILDFSKIEAGKLELECMDFRISECVARAAQMMVLRAAEKGLEIACRVAPEIADHLRGDSGRVQQVLVNLLSNAVKFTEVGEIFVNVNAESITADKIRLHISVSDTGIGVPDDKRDQVFSPFEQAESSTTRRFGGTGLGLAISRQLVEMMHGRIWVDSELGRGSTFHFTSEFGIAADQHRPDPVELGSLQGLPVLVVDDNVTNRRILSEMLQQWDMQPVLADSAAAARQALQTAEASQRPIRLILLDHHMPGEDGVHFAESIRGKLNYGQCPIIMISSGSSPSDVEIGQKYGIDRFMTKPVIASELLDEVLRQFGRYTTAMPAELPSATPHSQVHPRRVLLVEDNEINRRVAVGLLHSRGHQVVLAENGQEAVNTLADQEFDVVLMDMQMPVMDGYEATAAIRQREHQTGGHIPIVAMTAEALKGDRERCLNVGMDDYVSKPIKPTEMYRAIERFPALCLPADAQPRDRQASAEAIVAEPHGSTNASPARQLLPQTACDATPAVDWNVAKDRFGGRADVLTELSEMVKVEAPALLAELRQSIETRDFKRLQRSAHTLKGSVGYFGAEPLVQAALALEILGRKESFDNSAELLATLERELARVLAALDAGPPESPR